MPFVFSRLIKKEGEPSAQDKGGTVGMQDMIQQIVEMDRKAREITDAAQQEKVHSEKEIAKRREEIRTEYLAKARRRIALNEPQERAAAEKAWERASRHYEEVSRALDERYQMMGDRWVQEIVARVLGA